MIPSRSSKLDLKWADGSHSFKLGIGELEELQEKCDAGPPLILERLSTNKWFTHDVRETIRLGLIGGGATPGEALKLVERYVDARPDWMQNALFAQAILSAVFVPPPDEDLSKKKRKSARSGNLKNPKTPNSDGSSPDSTEPAPS